MSDPAQDGAVDAALCLRIAQDQLTNAPDWIRTELWDAKGYADVPGQPNREQMQALVRMLLAERFGLVMHMEKRMSSVYMLTVAKGGAKIAARKGDPNGLRTRTIARIAAWRQCKLKTFQWASWRDCYAYRS